MTDRQTDRQTETETDRQRRGWGREGKARRRKRRSEETERRHNVLVTVRSRLGLKHQSGLCEWWIRELLRTLWSTDPDVFCPCPHTVWLVIIDSQLKYRPTTTFTKRKQKCVWSVTYLVLERNFILFNAVHDYHDYRIEAERGLPLLGCTNWIPLSLIALI